MNLDSLLEYIFPVIFILVVLATKIAEARLKKSTDKPTQDDGHLSPRTAQDIRKEIQKKILERAQGETAPQPSQASNTAVHENHYLVKLKQEKERAKKAQDDARKIREQLRAKKQRSAFGNPKRTARVVGIRNALRTPHVARNAYLYHEIFASPVSLRREGVILPSWKL